MKFQEFCVKQIKHALGLGLTHEQLDSEAYKLALKRALVRTYSEAYYLKAAQREFVFWDIDFGSHRIVRKHEVWKSLLCSEGAYALCEAMEKHKGRRKVYYEHIEPAGVIYNQLMKLNGTNPSEEAIKRILERCKLVALTEEEVVLLNARENSSFTEQDEDVIEQWHKEEFIDDAIRQEALDSMKDGSAYACGTAYARLAHLTSKKVKFVWGEKRELEGGALIAAYLKDHNHDI